MSEFSELIKELALNAVEAEKPVEAVIGVVISVEPLEIRLEQKLIIDRSFIYQCKGASYDTDDNVVLLRCSGGQKYILIDSIGGV